MCLQTPLLAGSTSIEAANAALQSSSVPRFADMSQSDAVTVGSTLFPTDVPPLLLAVQSLSQKLHSVVVLLDDLSRVYNTFTADVLYLLQLFA